MTTPGPNDTRRPDARKDLCDELAERLAEGGGRRTARLLEALGLAPGPGTPPPAPAAPPGPDPAGAGESRPISIWRPATDGGRRVFERPPPHPLGDHHAARRILEAAKPAGTRRLCLLGESVAAGYLYAPHLTPATVLQRHLDRLCGAGAWEVVDLARTNETLSGLATTAEAARQLSPDRFVLFAGNNWTLLETPEISPYAPSVAGRQRYAAALRRDGLAGPVELARGELGRRAAAALGRVAAAAASCGAPLVALLPEVNLADWESRQPTTWLPGDGTARWHRLERRARAALAAGRAEEAAEAAREMQRLDGGAGPTAWRLAARAAALAGRPGEATAAARAEIDRCAYATLGCLAAPQAGSAARRILATAAAEHGWRTVDLPHLFAEWSGSPLPGRRLFLDYCHLTAEGMHLAMAATAAAVLAGDGREHDPLVLARELPAPAVPPAAEATALLGAAVHTAHRLLAGGGAGELLEHWCRQALAADPGVAAAMVDLADARTAAPCPAVLTAAQQRNLASPHRLTLQHGWRWDFLDAELLTAAGRALTAAGRTDAAGELQRLLVDRHATGPGGVDLARAPYPWQPLERLYPEVMRHDDLPGRAVWRAAWPRSGFCLVTADNTALELELVARLPPIPGWQGERLGDAELAVDGVPLATLPLGEGWSRHRVALPAGRLAAGFHRLTVVWPDPPPAGDAAIGGAVERLEDGLEADLHPIFGELWSLRAGGPR